MKRTNKIVLTVIVSLIMCFSIMNYTYANSFNFSLGASASTVKPGDSVTIDLKISAIDVGDLGINAVEAVLNYDENVFEPVTQSSFSGANNWSITYNGEDGDNKGKLLAATLQGGVKDEQSIGKLTLKVKKEVSDVTSQVSFSNIETNDGNKEIIKTSDQTVNIKVSVASTNNSGNGSGSSSSGSGSNGSGVSGGGSSGGTSSSGSSSSGSAGSGATASGASGAGSTTGAVQASSSSTPTKLPYAGEFNLTTIIFLVIIISAIGVITFVCYKKIDN